MNRFTWNIRRWQLSRRTRKIEEQIELAEQEHRAMVVFAGDLWDRIAVLVKALRRARIQLELHEQQKPERSWWREHVVDDDEESA